MQAFEEMEQSQEVVLPVESEVSEDISALMLEHDESVSEISETETQVAEAEETQGVLEQMEAAATPEEAVCIAKEHFLNIIGYTDAVSVESFKTTDATFVKKFEGSIELAQEGIASRVMDSLEFAITSEAKVLKETSAAVAKLGSSGSKEANIEEPGWGRYFSAGSKKEMSFEDVMQILTKYKALVTGSELKEACEEIVTTLEDSTAQYKKNIFVVSSERIDKMKENNDKIQSVFQKIKGIVNADGSKKVDATFTPLTAEQAKKIGSEIELILNDKGFKESYDKMKKAMLGFQKEHALKAFVRGAAVQTLSPSGRAATKTVALASPVISSINKVIGNKSKVCYAAMQYIKASTK
jgi:hypothetical protein